MNRVKPAASKRDLGSRTAYLLTAQSFNIESMLVLLSSLLFQIQVLSYVTHLFLFVRKSQIKEYNTVWVFFNHHHECPVPVLAWARRSCHHHWAHFIILQHYSSTESPVVDISTSADSFASFRVNSIQNGLDVACEFVYGFQPFRLSKMTKRHVSFHHFPAMLKGQWQVWERKYSLLQSNK